MKIEKLNMFKVDGNYFETEEEAENYLNEMNKINTINKLEEEFKSITKNYVSNYIDSIEELSVFDIVDRQLIKDLNQIVNEYENL